MSIFSCTYRQGVDNWCLLVDMSEPAVSVSPLTVLEDVLNDNVRRNVRSFMAGRRLRPRDVYRPLGLSRQVFSNRLAHARFTAAEVRMLAYLLDVPVERLYETPELVVRTTDEPTAPPVQQLLETTLGWARSRCASPLTSVPLPPGAYDLALFDDGLNPLYGERSAVRAAV